MTFVQEWPTVLKRSATTWVGAAVHFVMAIVGVHWAVLLGVLPFVPHPLQLPLAVLVALTTLAPTLIARIWSQPKLNEKVAEKVEAKFADQLAGVQTDG